MHESPMIGGVGRYRARRGVDFPAHSHVSWELVYYTRGTVGVRVGEVAFDAAAGILVSTPPRVAHSEIAVADYENIYVEVHAPADAGWPLVVHDGPTGRIRRVLEAMLDEQAGTADEDRAEMRALLGRELDLLIRRAARSATAPSGPARLVAAAEFRMSERLSETLPLADLARELGVAPSTLRLAFASELGMPARRRLAELRLERALALLRGSTMTLEHIAGLSGFSSASHLARSVRSATGRTPGEIRRSPAA